MPIALPTHSTVSKATNPSDAESPLAKQRVFNPPDGLRRFYVTLIQWIPGLDTLRKWLFSPLDRWMIHQYLQHHPIAKIHIACGRNLLNGWLNTDLNNYPFQIAYLDALKPLPFTNDSIRYLFSEHHFEHLTLNQGLHFLTDCHRVLKPGGKLRMALPSLDKYIALWQQPQLDEAALTLIRLLSQAQFHPAQGSFMSKAMAFNGVFYAHQHRFIYDQETLSTALKMAGFECIDFFEPGQSNDSELCGLEFRTQPHDCLETMVVEAQKPF